MVGKIVFELGAFSVSTGGLSMGPARFRFGWFDFFDLASIYYLLERRFRDPSAWFSLPLGSEADICFSQSCNLGLLLVSHVALRCSLLLVHFMVFVLAAFC